MANELRCSVYLFTYSLSTRAVPVQDVEGKTFAVLVRQLALDDPALSLLAPVPLFGESVHAKILAPGSLVLAADDPQWVGSTRQIAQVLGISEVNVRVTALRALRKLRAGLEQAAA